MKWNENKNKNKIKIKIKKIENEIIIEKSTKKHKYSFSIYSKSV